MLEDNNSYREYYYMRGYEAGRREGYTEAQIIFVGIVLKKCKDYKLSEKDQDILSFIRKYPRLDYKKLAQRVLYESEYMHA